MLSDILNITQNCIANCVEAYIRVTYLYKPTKQKSIYACSTVRKVRSSRRNSFTCWHVGLHMVWCTLTLRRLSSPVCTFKGALAPVATVVLLLVIPRCATRPEMVCAWFAIARP